MNFENYTQGNDWLIGSGYSSIGQDGHLNHIYLSPEGKEVKLSRAMSGGYELKQVS